MAIPQTPSDATDRESACCGVSSGLRGAMRSTCGGGSRYAGGMIGRIICGIVAVWMGFAATGALAVADGTATLRPYLDDQTLGVMRIDLNRIDPAGLQKALVDALAQVEADGAIAAEANAHLAPMAEKVAAATAALRAAGAREAFVIASMADGQLRWGVVVPDATAVEDAAKAMQALGLTTRTVDGVVIGAADEATIKAMRARPAADRADLLAILERADASPIRIAIAPGAAVRRTADDAPPAADPMGMLLQMFLRSMSPTEIDANVSPQGETTLTIKLDTESLNRAMMNLRGPAAGEALPLDRELRLDSDLNDLLRTRPRRPAPRNTGTLILPGYREMRQRMQDEQSQR